MGIPTTAFRTGDLYIEYAFENALFRYHKESARFFRKFYNQSEETEIPHDSKLLCDAECSGVLTTAERYANGRPPAADPTADRFSFMAVTYQRARPYWLSVMHLRDYAHSGTIEVGGSNRIEVIQAADTIEELLEKAVSDINARSCFEVTCADDISITIDKESKDFDFFLRLELKKKELTVTSESSLYHGRSNP